MGMTERIRVLLVKQGNLSEAELARRLGIAPQNLNRKLKRDNFTVKELEKIAAALDCNYEGNFVITSSGEKI